MATIYNLTNVTNSTNIYELAIASNQITGGIAGTIMITVMYFITFVSLKGWANVDAFGATSFGYGVIATLLFLANLIPETVFYTYIILMVTGLFILLVK